VNEAILILTSIDDYDYSTTIVLVLPTVERVAAEASVAAETEIRCKMDYTGVDCDGGGGDYDARDDDGFYLLMRTTRMKTKWTTMMSSMRSLLPVVAAVESEPDDFVVVVGGSIARLRPIDSVSGSNRPMRPLRTVRIGSDLTEALRREIAVNHCCFLESMCLYFNIVC
jgi:hypothetical protein